MLRQNLYKPSVLTLTEGVEDFLVYFHAFSIGLEELLMQRETVIAYASRQLKSHEVSYQMHDMGLGTVVFALVIW